MRTVENFILNQCPWIQMRWFAWPWGYWSVKRIEVILFSTFGQCLLPYSGLSHFEPVCTVHDTCSCNKVAVSDSLSLSNYGAMSLSLTRCAGNNCYIWHGMLKLWTVFKKSVSFTSANSSAVKCTSWYSS